MATSTQSSIRQVVAMFFLLQTEISLCRTSPIDLMLLYSNIGIDNTSLLFYCAPWHGLQLARGRLHALLPCLFACTSVYINLLLPPLIRRLHHRYRRLHLVSIQPDQPIAHNLSSSDVCRILCTSPSTRFHVHGLIELFMFSDTCELQAA